MSPEVKKLAERAGFVFWGDEPYGPGPEYIDWACNYDKEFEKFVKLLIKETKKGTFDNVKRNNS